LHLVNICGRIWVESCFARRLKQAVQSNLIHVAQETIELISLINVYDLKGLDRFIYF
jgi:hypothetical protein